MDSNYIWKGGEKVPYVNIKITREGEVTAEQKRRLIEGATIFCTTYSARTRQPRWSPAMLDLDYFHKVFRFA